MKDELVFFKTALRNLDYKHVSSEIKDNIEMRATYKNRNYIFHFNSKYKVIVVEQIESLHEHEFDVEEYEILQDLKAIIDYTQFEGYNIVYLSMLHTNELFIPIKKMQIVNLIDNASLSISKIDKPLFLQGIIINRDKGLYEFDDRLFENNWYEDFTNKLDTYTEEELFLMIETFSSYFYKIYANKWNGEKIDLFVIEYFNEKAIEYTKRYESDFEKWYAFWDEYFTDDVREKYLKSKKKLKS